MDEFLFEVDVAEVEAHGLGAPQSGGVDDLDEGAVPHGDGAVALERLEHLLDLDGRGGIG